MRHITGAGLVAALIWAGASAPALSEPAPAADTDCAAAAWPLDAARARLAAPNLKQVEAGRRIDPSAGAVMLALRPQSEVAFVHPPERPADGPEGFGGTFVVPIARAGLWQITLSDKAWIDVVAQGRLVPAAAFTGVHRCPGVRKSVRFQLQPGTVILQLSGAPAARLGLSITTLDE